MAILGIGAGEELPSIQEIIQLEGQFAFTDGSSVFQFYSDGSFFMEPTGLSGRAAEQLRVNGYFWIPTVCRSMVPGHGTMASLP